MRIVGLRLVRPRRMMRDGEELTENGNIEDCSGDIASCVGSSCSEGVTWHAIQCR